MDAVSSDCKCRVSRLGNLDDDRLWRRLAFLRVNGPRLAARADARIEVRMLARELLLIVRELDERGVPRV